MGKKKTKKKNKRKIKSDGKNEKIYLIKNNIKY
jgi:hypothetical protein